MFKLREMSTAKLISSPQNIALLAVAVVLMAFIAYKAWQEYRIYQINEMVQSFPTASGGLGDRVITWSDDASYEDGYQIERRAEGEETYQIIDIVAIDSTSYSDAEILSEGEYCYRVAAFNNAGKAYSDDVCIVVSLVAPPPIPDAELPVVSITITSSFSGRPGNIKLNGRKFYSAKSGYAYNEEFTDDEMNNLEFSVVKGKLRLKDSNAFVFKEQGENLDNGFARMKLHDLNNISFTLQGNEKEQTATLYLSVGVWEKEETPASPTGEDLVIDIIAGEVTHQLSVSSRNAWHYATVDIAFSDFTEVSINPVGRHKWKSSINFAGIILNEGDQTIEPAG